MPYPAISGVEDPRYLRSALIRGDQIISAPMSVHHQFSTVFNVRDYGALGDGTTNDQVAISAALADALAANGTLYFPAVADPTGFGYRGSIAMVDQKAIRIVGDGYRATVLTHITAADTISITGTTSGATGDIVISDMKVVASSGFEAIVISNALHFEISRVEHITSMRIEGSGGFINSVFGYGENALFLGSDSIGMTATGPLTLVGCSWYNSASSGSPSTAPAVRLLGNVVNCNFHTCLFSAAFASMVVKIDGLTGQTTAYGGVSFHNCGVESAFNAAGTSSNFIVGEDSPYGAVAFYGGTFTGHGDGTGTHYSNYWLRLYSCHSVVVDGVMLTKLANPNGFNGGTIRLETGYPAAGQQYAFRNLYIKDSLVAYSDANGVLVTYTGNDWNGVISGSATYNPANLVDGDGATTTVTATGATLGMFAQATFNLDLQGIMLNAWVSAANTVSVRFQNETGGAIDLGSGTIRVRVR